MPDAVQSGTVGVGASVSSSSPPSSTPAANSAGIKTSNQLHWGSLVGISLTATIVVRGLFA